MEQVTKGETRNRRQWGGGVPSLCVKQEDRSSGDCEFDPSLASFVGGKWADPRPGKIFITRLLVLTSGKFRLTCEGKGKLANV